MYIYIIAYILRSMYSHIHISLLYWAQRTSKMGPNMGPDMGPIMCPSWAQNVPDGRCNMRQPFGSFGAHVWVIWGIWCAICTAVPQHNSRPANRELMTRYPVCGCQN